jgi:hypothetical protein
MAAGVHGQAFHLLDLTGLQGQVQQLDHPVPLQRAAPVQALLPRRPHDPVVQIPAIEQHEHRPARPQRLEGFQLGHHPIHFRVKAPERAAVFPLPEEVLPRTAVIQCRQVRFPHIGITTISEGVVPGAIGPQHQHLAEAGAVLGMDPVVAGPFQEPTRARVVAVIEDQEIRLSPRDPEAGGL